MKNYLPSLNGLRALSITIVILGHINHKCLGKIVFPFPFSLFFDAGFGVNVFFVISGFLITTLLLKEEASTGTISLKGFYKRRAFRIFPAYYLLLLVYFILQLAGVLYFTRASWLSSIFYYKYLAGGDWASGHFWSLSVEEHFYLVWPLVFLFFKKFRVYFAYIVILLVMFFRYNAYVHYFPSPVLSSDVSIFQRVDAIMIGCLLALQKDRWLSLAGKLNKYSWSPLLLLLLLAFFSSDYLSDLNVNHHLHLGVLFVPLGIGLSTGLVSNLLIGLLILVSMGDKSIWFRWLNTPWMNFVGKLSYSLYLWQQMFFAKELGSLSHLPVNVLCMIACALISYYFVELPFLRLKGKYEVLKNAEGMQYQPV